MRARLRVAQVRVDAGPKLLSQRQRPRGRGQLADLGSRGAVNGDVEVSLGREVVIQKPARDPRSVCDLLHPDLVVGARREELHADPQQLVATVIDRQPAPSSGGGLALAHGPCTLAGYLTWCQ